MRKLLHIIASPREEESRTLKVSHTFLEELKKKEPHLKIETLDLAKKKLPEMTHEGADGKYMLISGKELGAPQKEIWDKIVAEIHYFLSFDLYLISTPMWNFGIPYRLKHYIDVIAQPKYLFRYTDKGVEGLAKGKKMMIISSRGGDYSSDAMRSQDFIDNYLKQVFGFAGITDVQAIHAEPMDMGLSLQLEGLRKAHERAKELSRQF